jgi:hypothetical protein
MARTIRSSKALNLGVDRTYVSRVVKGERRSSQIEAALVSEFDRCMARSDELKISPKGE